MSDESMSRSEASEASSPSVSREPSESEVELHGTTIQSNEAVVQDESDVGAHGASLQSNEAVVEDDSDVEPHSSNWPSS
jgi:hypothetical protein